MAVEDIDSTFEQEFSVKGNKYCLTDPIKK